MKQRGWLVWVLVFLSLGTATAEEEPWTDQAATQKSLTAAREIARLVAEDKAMEAVEGSLDATSVAGLTFGPKFAAMEPAERTETSDLLKALFAAELRRVLGTKEGVRKAHFDAAPLAKGRVVVTVHLGEADDKPRGAVLVFQRAGAHMRLVDLAALKAQGLVHRLREPCAACTPSVRWLPLATAWSHAAQRGVTLKADTPVWRAPLPRPNPAWLSRELLSLPIEQPRLAGLRTDKAPASGDEDGYLVVSITEDARILFRPGGGYAPLQAFDVGVEDPGLQDDAIVAFTKALEAKVEADPSHRHKDGRTKYNAVIHADRRTTWRTVQWVLQALAGPKVRTNRIRFSLRRSEASPTDHLTKTGAKAADDYPLGVIRSDLPTDRSAGSTMAPLNPAPPPKVKIKLFRRDLSDPEKAYTLVKIDNEKLVYSLPRGWLGPLKESAERVRDYQRKVAAMHTVVSRKVEAHGGDPKSVRGEIVTPPPKGGAVPYGDVMQMVHLLRQVGIRDIVYEGAATPLTHRERSAREALRQRKQR